MDSLIADSETMELMRKEYEKLHIGGVDALAFKKIERTPTLPLFLLYFVAFLGYNVIYGHQIFDSSRDMGRLRPFRTAFGELNNIR